MKTISHRNFARTAALTFACALLAVATVRAAEIKVVTSGAFTAAYLELAPEYERATHNKLLTEFGPSMGTTYNAIPIRLERGETIDNDREEWFGDGQVRVRQVARCPSSNLHGCAT